MTNTGSVVKPTRRASLSYSSRTQVARRSTPRLTISGPFEGPIHTPRADLRIHRFAQDSVKPGQWVKLESGDHRCAIGKPVDIVHSVASVALTSIGDDPDLLIPLRALAPFYRYGDNVKCRWPGSCGLVTSVDEVEMELTFVEKDYNNNASSNSWTRRSFDTFIRSPPSTRWSHTTPLSDDVARPSPSGFDALAHQSLAIYKCDTERTKTEVRTFCHSNLR